MSLPERAAPRGETSAIADAPDRRGDGGTSRYEVLLLSAATPEALEAATDRLAARLSDESVSLALLARALREAPHGDHRRMIVGRTAEELAAALIRREPARVFTRRQPRRRRAVDFLVPGLGDQYGGMGRALYDGEPAFREALDECADLAQPHLGLDLREALYPAGRRGDPGADEENGEVDLRAMVRRGAPAAADRPDLSETRIAQPAVFAVGYATARCLERWGVAPRALLGHSLGEYVAAAIAGVFSLSDAVGLVCHRAELVDGLPRGAMLAVAAAELEVMRLAGGDEIDLAAVNGEHAVVVSGPAEAVERLRARLADRAVSCRQVPTTHAFHSRMLAGAQRPLVERLRAMTLRTPSIPVVSNVTGTWLRPDEATDPWYWARHTCRTVRFSDGLGRLLEDSDAALVEVGPGLSLGSFARQHRACDRERVSSILSTIPAAHLPVSSLAFFRTALGKLWLSGVDVDWRAGAPGLERERA